MLLAIVFAVEIGRYHLQSNPWVNLHQRLMYEAQFGAPAPAGLSADQLARWKKAVDDYRVFLRRRNALFDAELVRINTALSATSKAELPEGIPPPAATVLNAAMPLYRVAQWEEDDRANRFWIAVAQPLILSAGEELAAAHAKAYGMPFPTHIRVDVASFAGEFGAYTVGEGDSAHAVIMSTNPGTQGFGALESLMHEPSHAIVDGATAAIGPDITRAARELNVKAPYNLWHAILFYTSGELTRRALARRGVADYKPFISSMYEGPFRGMKQPLETHWQAYLDGKETREGAIRAIVSALQPRPAGRAGHARVRPAAAVTCITVPAPPRAYRERGFQTTR
ncbi:MAG TPA: hypothetical protein VGR02_04780 [Thermoanaerobaculia bacterium]|jgi:hypothetical protein|nr:hypothetical protein [Thermoanaerobaculia bacterium]